MLFSIILLLYPFANRFYILSTIQSLFHFGDLQVVRFNVLTVTEIFIHRDE